MRLTLMAAAVMALVLALNIEFSSTQYAAAHYQQPSYHQQQSYQLVHYEDDDDDEVEHRGLGAVLAAILATKSFKLGFIKGLLFKPVALLVLAKLKVALLLGKPLALLVLKTILLKTLLGGLLLKIPLLLLAKKVLLLNLKFALIAKGLIGLKAPVILLFLAAAALGKGTGLLALLGKFKHFEDDNDYDYDQDYVSYSPPVSYGQPIYTPQLPSVPVHPSGYPQQQQQQQQQQQYQHGRKKRFIQFASSEQDDDDQDDNDVGEEEDDDVISQFRAARKNGDAYLLMASHFDQNSCGRRLICEIYEKPRSTLTDNEMLLQELFGYPVPALRQNEIGSGRELYHRAALLGSSANGRHHVCQRHYAACSYTSRQLIDIFINNEDVDTNEIPQGRPIYTPHVSPVRQPFAHPQRQTTPARPQQQQQQQQHRPQHHQQRQQQQQQRKNFVVRAPAAA